MSKTVPYGFGVLSQGEIITSQDQDRLVTKRAWLQLFSYLLRHDERLLATILPVPWSLSDDAEICNLRESALDSVRYLATIEGMTEEIGEGESPEYSENDIKSYFSNIWRSPRAKWMIDKAISYNPLTVLDCGAGWGEIAYSIANHGIHVIALTPCPSSVRYLSKVTAEEGLSVEILGGLLEECDFGDRKFDVVLCGEVIEHVANDMTFIEKAISLASRAVIVTTPFGSVERGFLGSKNDHAKVRGQHVRAYSEKRFNLLVDHAEKSGLVKSKGVEAVEGIRNLVGDPVKSFCSVLEVISDAGVKHQDFGSGRDSGATKVAKHSKKGKARKQKGQPA